MNKHTHARRIGRLASILGSVGLSLLVHRQACAVERKVELSGPLVLVPAHLSPGELCQRDQDGNGLDDEIELELANQVTPVFYFSALENALTPNEPNILFTVHRTQLDQVDVKFDVLWRQDGGFTADDSNSPGALIACHDAHEGDCQPLTVRVRLEKSDKRPGRKGGGTWSAFVKPIDGLSDSPNQTAFDHDAHATIFCSAGKHHFYTSASLFHYPIDFVGDVTCTDMTGTSIQRTIPPLTSLNHSPLFIPAPTGQDPCIFGVQIPPTSICYMPRPIVRDMAGGSFLNACSFSMGSAVAMSSQRFRSNNLSDLGYTGQYLNGEIFYSNESSGPYTGLSAPLLTGQPDPLNPWLHDADGDGLAETVTFATVPSEFELHSSDFRPPADPCPWGGSNDLDSDGVPDACDSCAPADCDRLPASQRAACVANGSQSDQDGDGFGDACDVCPGKSDANTLDDDLIPDACDNCPKANNDDQADADGDGIGDVCDPCPCDAAPFNALRDSDSVCDYCQTNLPGDTKHYCDGPDQYCLNHPVDNCIGVDSSNQNNCNADAERKESALVLGDLCDPVPCPAFIPNYTVVNTVEGPSHFDSNTGAVTRTDTLTVHNDSLAFDLVGSHGAPGQANQGTLATVSTGETRYRYCTNLPSALIDCDDISWVGRDADIDQQPETTNLGWHRVKTSQFADQFGVDVNNRVYGGTGPQSQFALTWDWQSDFNRWKTELQGPFVNLGVPDQVNEGRGRFWVNFRTTVGTTTDVSTGRHGLTASPSTPAPAKLANHFESFAPIEEKIKETTFYLPLFSVPAFLTACAPVGCPADLGIPSLDDCPMCQFNPRDFFRIYEKMPLAWLDPTRPDAIGGLTADGSYSPLWNNFSPSLQALLGERVTLVGAVEPSASIGASSSHPDFLVMTDDGTEVVERIAMLRQGMLTTSQDRSERPLPSSRTSPASRSGFASVYARSSGEIFVVGGTNEDGDPRGDIWSRSLNGPWEQWQPVLFGTSESYEVSQVLASTYSYRDTSLYVLDTSVRTSEVRLVRISSRHQVQVLGQWYQTFSDTHPWLSLDRNGEVLLTIARESTQETRVFRIDNPTIVETGDMPTVAGWMSLPFEVKYKPITDSSTYWFIGSHASDQTPDVTRPNRLLLSPAQWSYIGASL